METENLPQRGGVTTQQAYWNSLQPIENVGKLASRFAIVFERLYPALNANQIFELTKGYITPDFISMLESSNYGVIVPVKHPDQRNFKMYSHSAFIKMIFTKQVINNYAVRNNKINISVNDRHSIRKKIAGFGRSQAVEDIIEEVLIMIDERGSLPFIKAVETSEEELKYTVETAPELCRVFEEKSEGEDTEKVTESYFPLITINDIREAIQNGEDSLDLLERFGILYEDTEQMMIAQAFLDLVKFYVTKGFECPMDNYVNISFIIISDLFNRAIQDLRLTKRQRDPMARKAALWLRTFVPSIYESVEDNSLISGVQAEVLRALNEVANPGSNLARPQNTSKLA